VLSGVLLFGMDYLYLWCLNVDSMIQQAEISYIVQEKKESTEYLHSRNTLHRKASERITDFFDNIFFQGKYRNRRERKRETWALVNKCRLMLGTESTHKRVG
jgi:hypothetical protein